MIYWPAHFPCFLLENHEGQDEDIYARTEVDFGPARMRRKYRVVPHQRKAELFLHDDLPKEFYEFFENDLDRGERRFEAPFQSVDGVIRFYETEFVEPYEADFVLMGEAKRAWRVRCKFRLYGDGKMDSGAMLPVDLYVTGKVSLRASSRVQSRSVLEARCGVNLRGHVGTQLFDLPMSVSLKGRVADAGALSSLPFSVMLSGWVK